METSPESEIERYHNWSIVKESPHGIESECQYSNTSAVTEDHVKNSPKVKQWLGNDKLVWVRPMRFTKITEPSPPINRLAYLQDKFNKSGLNGKPVITDKELAELQASLLDLADYMRYRNDITMVNALRQDASHVERMIWHREN